MKHIDRFVAAAVVLAALVSAAILERRTYAAAPTGHFKSFRIPTSGSDPSHITAGPDGNMWFTESNDNVSQIGRIDAAGNVTEFVVPTRFSTPDDIVAGPDGALWFTAETGFPDFFIGRVTTTGQFTGFAPICDAGGCSIVPQGIASGPDGNLWFTEQIRSAVVRLTPAGTFTFFPTPTPGANPNGITRGPDGALWFAELNADQIARVDTAGHITEFGPLSSDPNRITTGPDGNLWFTLPFVDRIGRITPTGTITEFQVPTTAVLTGLRDIVAGADGNLWFTEFNTDLLSQITTAGVVTDVQKARGGPSGIGRAPDGAIWLTIETDNKIGRFSLR
jgi:virginiamycin B lyase